MKKVLSKRVSIAILMILLSSAAGCQAIAMGGRESSAAAGTLQAVSLAAVNVADEFWSARLETNRRVTIPHNFKMCQQTGRIDNFVTAGARLKGEQTGKFVGLRFNDSDFYKVVEAASYSLHARPDPALDKYLDDLIAKIAGAQEDDGYLYTGRTIDPNNPPRDAGKTRWSYLAQSHELYCAGHLYEAAVAHYLATGKRTLLDVAIKNADLIADVFGPDKKHDVPGHQEIEIGLVKLYRVTNSDKYLRLAKFFLDERGHKCGRRLYGEYAQDHQAVIEQTKAVGHAVRACYMYCGMADVAPLTGDANFIHALDGLWQDVISHKLYLTGGIGARGGGEAFGNDYELPNATAYCETCAAVANAFWNHRMFLLHGDAKYLDVLERIIYNGFLSGIGLSGDKFFYPNPLAGSAGRERTPWFDCACCPPNVARFLAALPGYAYAWKGSEIYVNLYMGGTALVKTHTGAIRLTQQTRYPWDGNVTITVEPERPARFTLLLRIPGWARNQPVPSDLYRYANAASQDVTLTVNGKPSGLDIDKGFARINRKWEKGDTINIVLPMSVRRVMAHENIKDDAGRSAIERGPIVYCLEGPDNPNGVANLVLPLSANLDAKHRPELLGGVVVLSGQGKISRQNADGTTSLEDTTVTAVPYYAWAHRGNSQMVVWIPTSTETLPRRPDSRAR